MFIHVTATANHAVQMYSALMSINWDDGLMMF